MKIANRTRALLIAAVATLSTGCAGLTPIGRKVVEKLPDYEIRHALTVSCSEMLVRVDPDGKLSNSQQRAVVKVCEEMTKGVIIKPAEIQDAMHQSLPF